MSGTHVHPSVVQAMLLHAADPSTDVLVRTAYVRVAADLRWPSGRTFLPVLVSDPSARNTPELLWALAKLACVHIDAPAAPEFVTALVMAGSMQDHNALATAAARTLPEGNQIRRAILLALVARTKSDTVLASVFRELENDTSDEAVLALMRGLTDTGTGGAVRRACLDALRESFDNHTDDAVEAAWETVRRECDQSSPSAASTAVFLQELGRYRGVPMTLDTRHDALAYLKGRLALDGEPDALATWSGFDATMTARAGSFPPVPTPLPALPPLPRPQQGGGSIVITPGGDSTAITIEPSDASSGSVPVPIPDGSNR
jgi:hypothetical protein